jgi:hypothetical protein
MQTWRFLYTTKPTIKKAVTKTGAPLLTVTKFIVEDGKDYAECLTRAKNAANFNDKQLLGSRQLS